MWTWRYEGTGELTKSREGRRFVLALVASFGILCTGMAWTFTIGGDCNKLYHRLSHEQEALEGLRSVSGTAGQGKGAQ